MAIKHGIKYVYCYSIRKQSSSNGSNFISCWHFHGLAKSYASQIAGVGVEGAMQGAAAMGIGAGVFGASRMARGALGMGRNAGIGAWKGLRRQEGGFGQSPGITGKTANLAGQGVNIGAKKLRQAAIERAKKMYGG